MKRARFKVVLQTTTAVLLAAVLLCGCGKGTASSGVTGVSSNNSLPLKTDSGISDNVSWQSLGTTYNRDYIIQHNLVSGGYEWPRMYVEQKYQSYFPYELSVSDKSGFYVKARVLAEQEICALTYTVRFKSYSDIKGLTQTAEGFYNIDVQVIALTTGTEEMPYSDVGKISGILDGGDIITQPQPMHDFLKGDSRCVVKPVPVPQVGEGVKVFNMREHLPGWLINSTVCAAGKDTVIYIRNDGSKETPNYTAVIRNIATSTDLFSKNYGNQNWIDIEKSGGYIQVRYYTKSGEPINADTYANDGTLLSHAQGGSGVKLYLPGSGICILRENFDIFRLDEQTGAKTVLLEGNHIDSEKFIGYSLFFAIDDHRFAFAKTGYEWTEYTAVYDVSAMKETKFTATQKKLFPKAVGNGKVYLQTDTYEEGSPAELWYVDIDKISTEPTMAVTVGSGLCFSPDMKYAACLSENGDVIVIYDLLTMTKKAELPAMYVNVWEWIQFSDNNTLVAFSQSIALFDKYMITYKIK